VRITDVTVTLHDRTSPTLDVFGVPNAGFVHVPDEPGLRVDVDGDLIASATLGEVA
jgi:L-alanine-DL-glutamate epimerase-like enolase superfamily enzyme